MVAAPDFHLHMSYTLTQNLAHFFECDKIIEYQQCVGHVFVDLKSPS